MHGKVRAYPSSDPSVFDTSDPIYLTDYGTPIDSYLEHDLGRENDPSAAVRVRLQLREMDQGPVARLIAALVGFGGEKYEPAEGGKAESTETFFRVKTFEEPKWTEAHSGKVAALGATYSSTPLGACYRGITDYLGRQKPDYVVSITDGEPNDPEGTKSMPAVVIVDTTNSPPVHVSGTDRFPCVLRAHVGRSSSVMRQGQPC